MDCTDTDDFFHIYMTWFNEPRYIWMIISYACDCDDVVTNIMVQDVCDVMFPMMHIWSLMCGWCRFYGDTWDVCIFKIYVWIYYMLYEMYHDIYVTTHDGKNG